MISTVTTSTVSTVVTASLAGSVALIGILCLMALLVQKELAGSTEKSRYRNLSRALNIGILPLFIAFVLIVISRVANILN